MSTTPRPMPNLLPMTLALFDPSVRVLGEGRFFNVGAAHLAAAKQAPRQATAGELRATCFYSGLDDQAPEPHRPVFVSYQQGVPCVIGNNALVSGAGEGELLNVYEIPEAYTDLISLTEDELAAHSNVAASELEYVAALHLIHPDGEEALYWLRGLKDAQELLAYCERVVYSFLELHRLPPPTLRAMLSGVIEQNMVVFPLDEGPYLINLTFFPKSGLLRRSLN